MIHEVEMFPKVEKCPCSRQDRIEPCRWHEPDAWRVCVLSQLAHRPQEGKS